MLKLKVSMDRLSCPEAGILVRACGPNERIQNADISWLDRESLLAWLRSRGGENVWAENVVLALLGHEQIAPEKEADNGE